MTVATTFTVLGAICAFVAAGCWFRAGTVKVSPEAADKLRKAHMEANGPTGYAAWAFFDGSDMEFTLAAQSKWNRNGALAAGGAAVCQAIYAVITVG